MQAGSNRGRSPDKAPGKTPVYAAAQELLNRRAARRSLIRFTCYTYPRYLAERAHELIGETLDRVVAGELRRLMIFAPPQHGKSELASVRLPAYWLGRRPEDPVIIASYGASLAESKSRQARGILEGGEYGRVFPGIGTRQSSRAVQRWELEGHRGSLLAVGVNGPVTGHGAMLGIIDDPFENWKQAQSLVQRENVWEWYQTTFRTRIWEGGAIILIMTRWHEDDLAGRLLRHRPGEWRVLRLPALAEGQAERDENNRRLGLPQGEADPLGREADEPLCPQRFSKAALLSLKADVGTRGWAAEYQGSPRPGEGLLFRREWFGVVDALPAGCRFVRYWDKAGSEGKGDFTAGLLLAVAPDGKYYVVDVVRGQWSAAGREKIIRQTAKLDQERFGFVTIWLETEGGSSGKESSENTIGRLAGFAVHAEHPSGSKEVRAEPFRAQAEVGNVLLLRGAWNWAYLEELAAFPNGEHDDQVDTSSGAFNKLALGRPARIAGANVIHADGLFG